MLARNKFWCRVLLFKINKRTSGSSVSVFLFYHLRLSHLFLPSPSLSFRPLPITSSQNLSASLSSLFQRVQSISTPVHSAVQHLRYSSALKRLSKHIYPTIHSSTILDRPANTLTFYLALASSSCAIQGTLKCTTVLTRFQGPLQKNHVNSQFLKSFRCCSR